MYTGYSDPKLTRIYRSIQGKEFITCNHTYFDGYDIHTEFISPYREPVPPYGTDGAQETPMSTPKDSQYVFIDSLYRVGELGYNRTVQHYGFDLLRYTIAERTLASSAEYPPNANFYQGIRGFVNLSFMGLPIFAGKNHFLDADSKWQELVELYDESGTHRQYANEFDESEVIIEPKTGATLIATIYLQSSFYMQQDFLFTAEPRMLPVVTIYRSANVTAEAVDDLFADLRIAIVAPTKLALLCVFGIIFAVFCTVVCTLKQQKA
jgi:hypothetical protein